MSRKPWFPFLIDDWWGSTRVRLMGAEARDLYLDCLCRQWKDGAIPTDPKALAAILPGGRTAAGIARLWPRVAPHFEPAADGLVANPKLDAIRRKAHAVSAVRSEAGKLGGRPKGDANAYARANAFEEPKQSGTHTETETETELPRRPPRGGEWPGFEAFWAAYPWHVGKAAARKAWARLRPDAALQATLLAAIAWQRERGGLAPRTASDGRPVQLHAATWLNGRRWEDEPPAAREPEPDGDYVTVLGRGKVPFEQAKREGLL